MPDLVGAATAILSQAQQRAEIAGQNVANATMPGFKRRVAFAQLIGPAGRGGAAAAKLGSAIDFAPGKLVQTGSRFDLAVSGAGFFTVRDGSGAQRYVRAGRFTGTADGRLADRFGGVLQKVDGGDLVVGDTSFKVRADGQVMQDGVSIGRIAVYTAQDLAAMPVVAGGFGEPAAGLVPAEQAEVVQGAYEAANVSTGDEMVAMMQALRQAETGQRVMIAYDELMGRAISTFGENVR